MDFEITKREILVVIAFTLIMIGLGFLISSNIKNGVNERNEVYYKALKIDNDPDTFKYIIDTSVGWTLSYGKIQTIDGIYSKELDGTYMKVKWIREKYTRHTRQVTHTRVVNGKTQTYTTTEVYYSWDYNGEKTEMAQRFKFLGVEFDTATMHFDNEQYVKTINEGHNKIRYKYYVIPLEFEGTMLGLANNGFMSQKSFIVDKHIDEVIEDKKNETTGATILFWVIWVIVVLGLDFGYVVLENRYLED